MKGFFSIALILAAFQCSFAQLVASHDTSICAGQSVQLNATGGSTYTWSPANGLSSTSGANPVATPTGTTTYVVSSPVTTGNIVVNGNFSQGNTGFTSSYTYQLPPNNAGQDRYWVGPTPNSFSSGMNACPDHTGNNGNMIIANASEFLNTPVWCETLPVIPNITYTLSGYIQTLNQTHLPKARWMVNGTPVGTPVSTLISCLWTNFTATWNSGNNTIATFCVFDPDTFWNGNDFAMDDFSIIGNGNASDTVMVTILNAPVVNLGNDTSVCTGQSIILDAGNSGSTYNWSNGSSNQSVTVSTPGAITVTVTGANTCSATDVVTISNYNVSAVPTVVQTSCGLSNGMVSVAAGSGVAPYSYLWSTTETNDTIYNLAAGTYSVTVSDSKGCSASAQATVNTSGSNPVTLISAGTKICASDSLEICAPSGYSGYLWNTGDASECIYAKLAGNYYVTVTDNANCTSTSNHVGVSTYPLPSVSISVNGDTLTAYNAVTYQWYLNNSIITGANSGSYVATQQGNYNVLITDTNGCYASSNTIFIATGLNDLTGENPFKFYPNPLGNEKWTIETNQPNHEGKLEIFDSNGKLAYRSIISSVKSEIDLQLIPGFYTAKVTLANKCYYTKLVKL